MVHSIKNKGDWYKQWPEGENASAIYILKKEMQVILLVAIALECSIIIQIIDIPFWAMSFIKDFNKQKDL
jgi:hypothetical protein